MQSFSYPIGANTLSTEQKAAAASVLESNQFTMGKLVEEFEYEFATWTGAKFALMVNSGSSANLLMVDAMLRRSNGDKKFNIGDEILVPALSWPTTVWPLVQLGLKPVFVDVDPESLCLDLTSAESVLSSRTKGIFLIHVLGRAAEMEKYVKFCKLHSLALLEDCCESLGAHSGQKHVGNFGTMASFSTYFSHHLNTFEGGFVTCNDSELYDDLKSLRSYGWIRERSDREKIKTQYPEFDERFLFLTMGYNVRPTEIQAALGRVQLRKLERMLQAREELASFADKRVRECAPWLKLIGRETLFRAISKDKRDRAHAWMTLPFLLAKDAPCDLKKIKTYFEDHGVQTRPVIAGNLAKHPATQRLDLRQAASLKNSDRILESAFMIGCHPEISKEELGSLREIFNGLAKLN
jgi:CDP-6-deoxy-D-xylo-4-hexulose-3-dehydrase